MRFNAFCTDGTFVSSCDKVNLCAASSSDKRANLFEEFFDGISGNVYLPDMCDEMALENVCDYLVSGNRTAIVRAAYEMNESGTIEARYKLSPIMLLHRLGILDKCIIAGGVCLDNDDLDLMAQEGVALVITPSASAGYGHGFAPVCAALRRGIRVGVGTFDNKYNPTGSVDDELRLMRLFANAEMHDENALTAEQIFKITAFEI